MTEEQKILADKIISFYKGKSGIKLTKDALMQRFVTEDGYSKQDVGYVIAILEEKGILSCADGVNKNIFFLSSPGWSYTTFENLITNEREQSDFKKKKDTLDLKNAERVYKSYPLTKFLAWLGALSGVIALLIKLSEVFGWINSK